MKSIKNTLILSTLLAGSLAVSASVLAETQVAKAATTESKTSAVTEKSTLTKKQDKSNRQAIANKAKSQNELVAQANKGISEGLKKVIEATSLIKDDKPKEAITALQEATGKFDIALAANPDLSLIPVASTVKVTELLISPQVIKAKVDLSKKFLDESKVQAARAVLYPLQDDLVTRTSLLPMTTYPNAIKLATALLVDGKKDAALATLTTALSTFVEEVSVIPLSLLRVESMVVAASKLDKEKDKKDILALLSAAEEQLQVATALGYTTKSSGLYQDLSTQIAGIKKEATGGNVVEKLYDKLKTSIKSLISKKSAGSKVDK